jgi:hypothetical protein
MAANYFGQCYSKVGLFMRPSVDAIYWWQCYNKVGHLLPDLVVRPEWFHPKFADAMKELTN